MSGKRTRHIPIFIPHLGCPHCCVFCDQRTISGQSFFSLSEVDLQIRTALSTIDKAQQTRVEIAYFGGSFTAIDRSLMHTLLGIAQSYVEAGAVDAIRFSTRPDAVKEDLLDELCAYSISTIELGLQSLDDQVLLASQRGHTAAVAEDACRRIVARGYTLTGQMMLGLPQSSLDAEMYTARRICDLGAREVRVYPTVVLAKTPLAEMLQQGKYAPLSHKEAVRRAALLLELFEARGVDCLRIGLCENEGLRGECVVGGAHHPALGELVRGALYLSRMDALLKRCGCSLDGKIARFLVAEGKCSQALGQKRSNVRALRTAYGLCDVVVKEHQTLAQSQVHLDKIY